MSLLTLVFVRSIFVIFLSKLVDSLTGGNITVVQSYIGDLTDEKNRAKSLGLIGAAFGLGFILGPAFGEFLSRWGFSIPAFFAVGLSFINLLNIIFFLPDSKPAKGSKKVSFAFNELISVSSALTGVALSSLVTKFVERDKPCETLGIFNSVDSIMRILSPLVGVAVIYSIFDRLFLV
ncbi:MFS transporter [Fervidobacterium pennivorans]|uniref:MFS transporter n=1 Tax=Fervidobacterium pennivorans TaxID=93466 RepID=UPI00355C34C9